MKKLVLIAALATGVFFSANAQNKAVDPVLMKVDEKNIYLSEFMNVYKKNSNLKDQINDQKSVTDYIDLFTNLKLKVREAEKLGLDTSSAFKNELAGYRKQLAAPYLTDKNVTEALIEEAYARMKKDVRASHILIKVSEDALPKDTLEAYKKIMKYRDRAIKGEDFSKLAKESAKDGDPSATENGGDLGYFSAFTMIYPFETKAYSTKIGEISTPVRTRFGYHIIKVVDIRDNQGELDVAHIMIKFSENAKEGLAKKDDSLKLKEKADEIYMKLKNGASFEELAMQFSDDPGSRNQGGRLPRFGAGRMPLEFEKACFAITEKGNIAQPFTTKYGWHIVKLIEKKPIASYDELKNEIKTKVSKDSRALNSKYALINQIKKDYKVKEFPSAKQEMYATFDSSFYDGKWSAEKYTKLNKPMFAIGDKIYTQTDFAKYLESQQVRKGNKTPFKVIVDNAYKNYLNDMCVAYKESKLDEEKPEFKSLMNEYRDGMLFFDITEREVWGKSTKDSAGLEKFYKESKDKYMWEERADVYVYKCSTEVLAKEVSKLLAKNKSDKEITDKINKNSQLNLAVDNIMYLKGENKVVDANWKQSVSAYAKDDKDQRYYIYKVSKILPPTAKKLDEARGIITSDYQTYLEKEWLKNLKSKYKVEVDQSVVGTIK
jgi:peptidyl-prolyl cis-trans isomerase SurA